MLNVKMLKCDRLVPSSGGQSFNTSEQTIHINDACQYDYKLHLKS